MVTGGASGIGAALLRRFAQAGAQTASIDLVPPPEEGSDLCVACDVGREGALQRAIETIEKHLGEIDIFVSNAGVLSSQSGHAGSASDADWARCWSVNVMAQVYAARALLPKMIARGAGHFVTVASAAGLLNQIGDAAYSASKHAAVSFAESLAIQHAADGIGVSLVCPQYVATPLIGLSEAQAGTTQGLLSADEVAICVIEAVQAKRFLVLPHPEVHGYAMKRARDHDAWIKGMASLRQRVVEEFGAARPMDFYKLV